jgi:two-component system, response regulator YesN
MLKNKTITVFIVDDEQMIRELLIGMIDWDALGMRVTGHSGSAMEALELIEEDVPDIVFVDISMPFVNGLELTGLLTDRYPDMKIIILTGYQSYEYARQSLRIGVSDYLTKPISAAEVTQSLLRVKQELLDWYQTKSEVDRLRTLRTENLAGEQERIFRSLLYLREETAEKNKELEYLGIDLKPDGFQVALIELDEHSFETGDTEYRYTAFLYCMDATRNYLSKRDGRYVFSDITGKVVVLFNSGGNIIPCCRQLKAYLDNLLKCTVSIGIGKEYPDLAGVRTSYCQAADALKFKVALGDDAVVCYGEIEIPRAVGPAFSFDADMFRLYLRSGLKAEALACVRSLFGGAAPVQPEALPVIGLDVLSCLQKACSETGIDIAGLPDGGMHPYEKLLSIREAADMEAYLITLTTAYIEKRLAMKTIAQSDTINTIIAYIHANIADYTLSLTSVADHFRMNPSYISRLFKQKTACNFSKYITSVRVEKAVGAIRKGSRKVNEIAEYVGFIDPHYFGVCFRKVKGMSVSDYIKAAVSDQTPNTAEN